MTMPKKSSWLNSRSQHTISVFIDNLLIASNYAKAITDLLINKEKFKLKGTGPVAFHLRCNFFQEGRFFWFTPKKYIEKLLNNSYVQILGKQPTHTASPLIKGNHPELNTSKLLDADDMKIYQSFIGGLQWLIQIGCFDVPIQSSTHTRAPRIGETHPRIPVQNVSWHQLYQDRNA